MSGISAFQLVDAGFTKPQVEPPSAFLNTEAARRTDMAALKAHIEGVEQRLGQKISELRAELKSDIENVEHRLELKTASVSAELGAVKAELSVLKWMMGPLIAMVGAILIKLFIH